MSVLTPQIYQRNRLLPCAILGEMATSGVVRKRREVRALILAALYCRFARAVVDPQDARASPPRRFRNLYANVVDSSNLGVQIFGESVDVEPTVSPGLAQLLASMPEGLVKDAVDWAPPVVAPSRGKQPPIAVANQIPLALHRYFYPGEMIRVWMLAYRPGWQMTAAELATQVVHAFEPLVTGHRTTLVRACRTGQEASLLSGLGTTRCAEIRQQQGLLKT